MFENHFWTGFHGLPLYSFYAGFESSFGNGLVWNGAGFTF